MSGSSEILSGPMPSFAEQGNLPQVLVAAFEALQAGVRDRRSPFHTPVVASIGQDGGPVARVVVLRAFEPEQRQLRFHTDIRSHKFGQMSTDPRVAFTFYDAGMKLQIRCEGKAVLHHRDGVADAAWEASQRMSRICYGTSPAPGQVIGVAGDFSLPSDQEAIAAGRENFCAVVTHINRMEWLWLGFEGHRRARFIWDENGQVDAVWLVP